MPLLEGRSEEVVSANIATLIREGKPFKQAIAIALSEAGRSRDSYKITKDKVIHLYLHLR
jgi:hypothetical protein